MPTGSSFLTRVQRRLMRDYGWMSRRLLNPVKTRHAKDIADANWRELFPAEKVNIARPPALNDTDWRVFQSAMKPVVPAGRLVDLRDAYVIGEHSWIFTHDHVAVAGMWDRQGRMTETQRVHMLGDLSPARFAKARFLPGVTMVLNQVVGFNFYHFTNQIAPRLAIAAQVMDLNKIDHFILPDNVTSYMRELLRYAGIDESKIVPMDKYDEGEGFRCERLIATSNPGPHHVPASWANEFLRKIVPVVPSPVKSRRIFLARIDAPKRRLMNHDAVEKLLHDFGFEHVMLDGMPFAEQAAIFREAEIIVAVHGATLSHLIFAQPGTRVIELLPMNHLQPCFWTIGQIEKLDYSIILGSEKPSMVSSWRLDVDADLTIPVQTLKTEVEAAIAARDHLAKPQKVALEPAR